MGGEYDFDVPDCYASPGREEEPNRMAPRPVSQHPSGLSGASSAPRSRRRSEPEQQQHQAQLLHHRTSLEEAREGRRAAAAQGGVDSRIVRQMATLDAFKRRVAASSTATPPSRSSAAAAAATAHADPSAHPHPPPPPGVSSPQVRASRLGDLQLQLRLVEKQLRSKEQKLRTLESTLVLEEERADALSAEIQTLRRRRAAGEDLQRQPSPAGSSPSSADGCEELEAILQAEHRLARDAVLKRDTAEAACAMTEERCAVELQALEDKYAAVRAEADGGGGEGGAFGLGACRPGIGSGGGGVGSFSDGPGRIDDIRTQMRVRLQKVKDDMAAQFAEEKEKLENRVEYLTRMNDRKDSDTESLLQKKAEISAMIDQSRTSHKAAMAGLQSRYEHEHLKMMQHETAEGKVERELRMKSDECEKLRQRVRKAVPASSSQKPSSSYGRKASPGATRRMRP